MDELQELREYVIAGRTSEALNLIDELDAMSRHSTITNLVSFLVLAFVHLIKMDVEKRLTRSWQTSIRNALLEIKDRNQMSKKAAYYLYQDDWSEYFDVALVKAISQASTEVFGGKYKASELRHLVNRERIIHIATRLLALTYTLRLEELADSIDTLLEQEQQVE